MIIVPQLAKIGWNKIDGDLVIYNPVDEQYFVLNDSAGLIWTWITDNNKSDLNFDEALKYLMETYEVTDIDEAQTDLVNLFQSMELQGLVKLFTEDDKGEMVEKWN